MRLVRWAGLAVLCALTLVSCAPLLAVTLASVAADATGCQLDEGSVHPCLLGGADIGGALYTGFVMGWLLFVTWPGVLLSLGFWTWLAIRRVLRRRRLRLRPPASAASPPPSAGSAP